MSPQIPQDYDRLSIFGALSLVWSIAFTLIAFTFNVPGLSLL